MKPEEMIKLANKLKGPQCLVGTEDRAICAKLLLDAAVNQEFKMSPKSLFDAWERYVRLFGEQPHGTEKQIRVLLRLVRDENNIS